MSKSARHIAVIGAGIVGATLAYRLAKAGMRVTLFDRHAPGATGTDAAIAGASYGHAGHIATELVEPLPSPALLRSFWRELTLFGGPLAVPVARWHRWLPWALRFVRAAFQQTQHTQFLAPLVRDAANAHAALMEELDLSSQLVRNGHFQVWTGSKARAQAAKEQAHMRSLGIATIPSDGPLLERVAQAAQTKDIAMLHFPDAAHVRDPSHILTQLLQHAKAHGMQFSQQSVQSLHLDGSSSTHSIRLVTETETQVFDGAAVCTGAWARELLEPLGLKVPMEAAVGYHVELNDAEPLTDAPILYCNQRVLVTPMQGRLRASSFMTFDGLDAPAKLQRYEKLQTHLQLLGYPTEAISRHWRGPRPVLPDYLPAIGQVPNAPIWYAVGHQHIGLTLAPITGTLLSALICGRSPTIDLSPFDLRRFH